MGTPAPRRRGYRLCLLGAAGDTGNLGVSALHESVVAGVARDNPDSDLVVFDNGLGSGPLSLDVDGRPFGYRREGLRLSRRYYRPESLQAARILARVLRVRVPMVRAIDHADAVLDITGGDSFTDLYGPARFRASTMSKELVLERGRPLVLLPQTYGPFSPRSQERARSLVRRAATAWARDADSYEALKELLGDDFDAERHRQGVDVAFALPANPVPQRLPPRLREWLDEGRTLAGLNVSGLVHNDDARERYGLEIDHRVTIERVMAHLLDDPSVRVVLVPHVYAPLDQTESDRAAALAVVENLPADRRERVVIAEGPYAASEVKWLISRCDWFCGTRMHATIAALSTGVPCATIAYSLKARGVFASCGQSDRVADARSLSTGDAVEVVTRSFDERARIGSALAEAIPAVVESSRAQFGEILRLGVG